MTIDVAAQKALWKQAFGDTDAFVDGFFDVGFSPERCCTIEQEGKLAAALYWFDCLWQDKKLAYIYGVATDMDFQGQGLCRKLMEDTHLRLQETLYAGTVLVPADEGLYRMYEKMGYRGCCPMETHKILPGDGQVSLEKISPQAYGALRREFLPEGGIIQSMKTLRFYGTYGEFYCTERGAFCAAREEDTLYVQEFLGDVLQLPGIVAALGCQEAQVRLPGGDSCFAMYHSFTNEEDLPAYLGLALD